MGATCSSLMTRAPDTAVAPRDPKADLTRRGIALVAAASVCWSSGALIARLAGTGPWTTTFWRSVFAAAFLSLVVSLARRRGILALWREGGRPLVGAAVCMALASTCFIFSLAHTSVANTALLMSTGPFVAGLLGWLFLGERVPPRTWLTMALALVGVVIMMSSSSGSGALLGDLLAIFMSASFATATVIVRRHPEIQMTPAAALSTAITAAVALPLADPLGTSGRDLALLALFGVAQFGVGFLLFMAGARLIPVAETSLIGMLEIVLGPLWVGLVLEERPGAASLAGGALIFGALLAKTMIDLVPRRGGVPPRR